MKRLNSQAGSAAAFMLFIVSGLLLVAIVFGMWAYQGRQDYKNNVDQKIAEAVATNTKEVTAQKEKEFAEISKSPLRTWVGPEAYGAIKIKYPKTWSAYVELRDSSPHVDGYFAPSTVPSVDNRDSVFALRVRVNDRSYSDVMRNYESDVSRGTASVKPFKFKKVPHVVGSIITGQVEDRKQGTKIVVPLRANALEIWTESNQFVKDFNKYIVPNVTFSP